MRTREVPRESGMIAAGMHQSRSPTSYEVLKDELCIQMPRLEMTARSDRQNLSDLALKTDSTDPDWEQTCGDLDASGQEVLGVTGGPALPLSELLQVVNLHPPNVRLRRHARVCRVV